MNKNLFWLTKYINIFKIVYLGRLVQSFIVNNMLGHASSVCLLQCILHWPFHVFSCSGPSQSCQVLNHLRILAFWHCQNYLILDDSRIFTFWNILKFWPSRPLQKSYNQYKTQEFMSSFFFSVTLRHPLGFWNGLDWRSPQIAKLR